MPSVTDVQLTTTTDADPITQILLLLEKKQRNLGKRKVKSLGKKPLPICFFLFKEKLEGYQIQEKEGKELNKDQKEALAKYADVLGQIDGLKELNDQVKKIQTDVRCCCLGVFSYFDVNLGGEKSKTSFKTSRRRKTTITFSNSSTIRTDSISNRSSINTR